MPPGTVGDRGPGRNLAERALQAAAPGGLGHPHPTARIVGITLGHDERVHDLAAFKTLLANAVRWVARSK